MGCPEYASSDSILQQRMLTCHAPALSHAGILIARHYLLITVVLAKQARLSLSHYTGTAANLPVRFISLSKLLLYMLAIVRTSSLSVCSCTAWAAFFSSLPCLWVSGNTYADNTVLWKPPANPQLTLQALHYEVTKGGSRGL